MSNFERMGGCAWKLFQVALVLAMLGLVFLFIVREDKEKEVLTEEEQELVEREGADTNKGLIAKLKEMVGLEKKKLKRVGGSSSGGGGSRAMKIAQEKKPKGNIDLEELLKREEDVRKDVDMLAEGTTQVEQTVLWQIIDGEIYYRIILTPYDREAHKMMLSPSEALFISFVSNEGERLVPRAAAERLETRTLRVATKDGYAVGWFVDGKLPMEDADEGAVEKAQVGWIFSGQLHARLRQLQRPKGAADGAVSDPHGIKTRSE